MATMGRPTDYSEDLIPKVRDLAKEGATDLEIAEYIGVSVSTVNRWKAQHRDFRHALRVGKRSADARVRRSLYQRALGYSVETVKVFCSKDGHVTQVPIIEHFPPDTTAAIFWLKNRDRHNWRDRIDNEHTGPDGGPIDLVVRRIAADE
jgi:hypothetical protein